MNPTPGLDNSPAATTDTGGDAAKRLARVAAQALGAPMAMIIRRDGPHHGVSATSGMDGHEQATPLVSTTGEGHVRIVEDTHDDPTWASDPLVAGPNRVRFAAVRRLIGHDGVELGTLAVLDRRRRHLSEDALEVLADLGSLAECEIEKRTLDSRLELERAQAAMADEAARFQALVQHTTDGIVVIDAHGAISYASPAAAELVGLAPALAVGRNVMEFLHPGDVVRAEGALRSTAEAAGQRPRIELRIVDSATGRLRHVELVANSLLHDPVVRGIVLNVRDISERREIDRLKAEFMSVMSHELRTPLTSIRGALELVLEGVMGDISDDARPLVELADRNAVVLASLIDDILDLDRLTAGRIRLDHRPTAVSTLVDRAVAATRPTAAAAGVAVTCRVRGDGWVRADADRIHQVMLNLLGNAIKFAPGGSTVALRARPRLSDWVFEVIDRGPGIPPEELTRIFDQFQQVDSSDRRTQGGTGLGLPLAKAIIEQHGGDIRATSELGHGTTVWFTLPITEDEGAGLHAWGERR